MAITLHKADGFEHGIAGTTYVYDVVSLGTPTIVTTGHRSGLRGCRLNPAGANLAIRYNSAFTIVTVALYINFTTLPTVNGATFVRVRNTNGNAFLQWDNTNSQFQVDVGAASAVSGGPTITTGVWYRVVLEVDTSTGTAVIKATIDGGTEFSTSVAQASLASIDVTIGTAGTDTYDMVVDDIVISGTDGDYEQIKDWTNWEILSAIPTSDGTHNITTSGDFDSFTATAFSNATTNGNTFIGHRPLQAANTADQVIRQELGTTANYMEVLFENPANTHPNVGGVQTYGGHVEAASAGASLGEIQLMLSDSTVVSTTGAIDVINSTEDPGTTVTGRKRAAIAPTGGWDETKVDGLKARIGFSDNAPDVNFIDLMLEVVYYAVASVQVNPPRPTIVSDAMHRSFSW